MTKYGAQKNNQTDSPFQGAVNPKSHMDCTSEQGLTLVWEALRALRDDHLPALERHRRLSQLEVAFTYSVAIEKELYTDPVTQGHNRKAFMREYYRAILEMEKDHTKNYVLIFADLDGFKAVNDKHGHEEGDQALIEADDILNGANEHTFVARLGGDEFVILIEQDKMTDPSPEHIRYMMKRLFGTLVVWNMDTSECDPIMTSVGLYYMNGADMGNKGVEQYATYAMHEADKDMYKDKSTKQDRLAAAKASAEQALFDELVNFQGVDPATLGLTA